MIAAVTPVSSALKELNCGIAMNPLSGVSWNLELPLIWKVGGISK